MTNEKNNFGSRKTRVLAMFLGFAHLDICLVLSIVTDISTDFLYKMAVLAAGIPTLYIIGRSATHFSNQKKEE